MPLKNHSGHNTTPSNEKSPYSIMSAEGEKKKMHAQLDNLLDELEHSMRDGAFWSNASPSPEALSSQQPFCVDTLEFEEWLQFVMIPRFRWMIEQRVSLPTSCDISPMAEEAFKDRSGVQVTLVLRKIDRLLTQGSISKN